MSTSAVSPLSTPTVTTPAASSASTSAATGSAIPDANDALDSEDTFLQLLVAQLENQDPENPTDGTQFVTELAQFTTLQEDTQSRVDLDSINQVLTAVPAAASPTTTPTSTTPAATTPTSTTPTSTTPTSTTQPTNSTTT